MLRRAKRVAKRVAEGVTLVIKDCVTSEESRWKAMQCVNVTLNVVLAALASIFVHSHLSPEIPFM
jgi:hypothetical protein